ncbi:Serine/threonine-protein phosphatase 2A activator 1 [Sporothrix epigloea]|uniref:Serine/threonine-protein phosphatase 2A activator n=1 Tax=Sporothrix epigloea TaxID=1892477 RepID=A0ABP0D4Q6_9PEZI
MAHNEPEPAERASSSSATATQGSASTAMRPPPPRVTPSPTAFSHPKLEHLPSTSDRSSTTNAAQVSHTFLHPSKCINDGPDVSRFLVSKAYRDIGIFIMQLNHALCPRRITENTAGGSSSSVAVSASNTTTFTLQSPKRSGDPPSVKRLQALLARITAFIDEAPPDPGPRRFGNVSFRVWQKLLAERVEKGLLEEYITIGGYNLSEEGAAARDNGEESEGPVSAMDEVKAYFLGSFGSAQRLDYGTGHELSFLAFLGCLWKLRVFADGDVGADGEAVERSLVFGVLEPYFVVVRKLILTYTLEPAGSHGVWGLDDHAFLPYIFGSAQLTRPIDALGAEPMPQEGSAPRAPKPSDIMNPETVEVQRQLNLYFSAIGFINDVKKGPFWEHSPILFDVSGIRDGWGKINKGMIKMFNAEVLSKFPVVQHFVFGSLFSWDEDPAAPAPVPSIHMTEQPAVSAAMAAAKKGASPLGSMPLSGMTAASKTATGAPWGQTEQTVGAAARSLPGPGIPYSRIVPGGPRATTARPPATSAQAPAVAIPSQNTDASRGSGSASGPDAVVTKAPWAK